MKKVITYGSFDLLHYGHIRLLERAKALGDYLIVGVTSDDYDKTRGKINLQQSLMERVEAIRVLGIADEIVIEEYEGQKIDDIQKYSIDIFAIGSDWSGYFDYLNEYCKVIYLPRTEGISSSELREKKRCVSLGLVGEACFLNKVWRESKAVNGVHITALCTNKPSTMDEAARQNIGVITSKFDEFLNYVDAVYIRSMPELHYGQIKKSLEAGKHVLCESPMTLSTEQTIDVMKIAKENSLILMEAVKTAYATAYIRMLLMAKSGRIGDVVSVDSVCTSLRNESDTEWCGIHEWAPTALLPLFQILGTCFKSYEAVSHFRDRKHDSFTRMTFIYDHAVGSIRIGDGVKSEGELVVTGTKGYIYIPAPWWKTDYFEIRYENPADNKRCFYQLDGEGIRYELVAFLKGIERGELLPSISPDITMKISEVMERFVSRIGLIEI